MRLTPVAIATCVGIAVLALDGSEKPSAQVMGVTLGAPFTPSEGTAPGSVKGAVQIAPAYGPYTGRRDDVKMLTRDTVETYLGQRGFSGITNLQQRGGSYICEATGPRRERVRLVVDATSGEISGVQVIGFEDKRY